VRQKDLRVWPKAVCGWRRTPSQKPQARPGNLQLGWHASGLFRSINSRPAFCCYCPIFLSSEHVAEARREGVTRLTPRASERLQEGEQKGNKGNRGELPSLYSYPTNPQNERRRRLVAAANRERRTGCSSWPSRYAIPPRSGVVCDVCDTRHLRRQTLAIFQYCPAWCCT
jgi:hypothetical protein